MHDIKAIICSLAIATGTLSAVTAQAEPRINASHVFVSSLQAADGLYDTRVDLTLTNSGTENLASVSVSLAPMGKTLLALPGMNDSNNASLASLPVGATSTVTWQIKTILPANAFPLEPLLLNSTSLDVTGATRPLAVLSTPAAR